MNTTLSRRLRRSLVAVPIAGLVLTIGALPAVAGPTCSDVLGVEVHGQHVVEDYVSGVHGTWPPSGGSVGAAIRANEGNGAELAGGPGAGGHLLAGIAPGASFCTGSSSPGLHLP